MCFQLKVSQCSKGEETSFLYSLELTKLKCFDSCTVWRQKGFVYFISLFLPVVYCDYTASGLSLKFFEEFIINEVLPEYANVHSFLAGMACQTTSYRNDAK